MENLEMFRQFGIQTYNDYKSDPMADPEKRIENLKLLDEMMKYMTKLQREKMGIKEKPATLRRMTEDEQKIFADFLKRLKECLETKNYKPVIHEMIWVEPSERGLPELPMWILQHIQKYKDLYLDLIDNCLAARETNWFVDLKTEGRAYVVRAISTYSPNKFGYFRFDYNKELERWEFREYGRPSREMRKMSE